MTRVQHVRLFCICVAVLGEGPALSDQPKSDIPPSVAAILEKTVAHTEAVLDAAEGKVRAEVDRLTANKMLDEAIAVRDFISKVRRAVTDQVVPSPIGKWSCNDPNNPTSWVQLNSDGTALASWHREPSLWTPASDGKIRMLYNGRRGVVAAVLSADGNALQLSEKEAWSRFPTVEKRTPMNPSEAKPIVDDALKAVMDVLNATAHSLKDELNKFAANKQLDEALMTREILASFRRIVVSRVLPSVAGKWSWRDGKLPGQPWVQLNTDGTATASWHKEPCIWTTSGDGRLRMIITPHRAVLVGDLSADGKFVRLADGSEMERIPAP